MSSYNHEKYVGQAIESVLNQTYRDFIFLVADDGSTDRTQDVLIEYGDMIDEVHLFEDNAGGRTGFLMQYVNTKYVALMNSDDIWVPDKLEKQVAYMQGHPECGACFTGVREVDDNGNDISKIVNFEQSNRDRWEWIAYLYKYGNCLSTPSILIQTEIYRKIRKEYNPGFRQIPDFHCWIRLLQKSEIRVIEEPLMMFRWHNDKGNVSALRLDNEIRNINEECYMWYKEIADMDKSDFKKVFGNMFMYLNAGSDAAIQCEKYFILLRARMNVMRQAAVFYFYDIIQDEEVQHMLEEVYHYTKKDFFEIQLQIGFGKLMEGQEVDE